MLLEKYCWSKEILRLKNDHYKVTFSDWAFRSDPIIHEMEVSERLISFDGDFNLPAIFNIYTPF